MANSAEPRPPTLPPPPKRDTPPPKPYADVNVNEHVRLTSIVRAGDRWEAQFYNVFDNQTIKVKARDRRVLFGQTRQIDRIYQNIPIWDSDGEKKSARVVRVTSRDIYFYYDERYYVVHIGETLAEAFDNRALRDFQLKELNLPEEPDK